MKRTAGTIVTLALLAGCHSSHQPRLGAAQTGDSAAAEARNGAPQVLPDLGGAPGLPAADRKPAQASPSGIQLTSANADTGLGHIINCVLRDHPAAEKAAPAREAASPSPLPHVVVNDPNAHPGGKVYRFNSDLVIINYSLRNTGSVTDAGVDLWYRQEGQDWRRAEETAHQRPPFVLRVHQEGLYGVTLLARNADGTAKPAPQATDRPQMWIEVDLTKPAVQLQAIESGVGNKARNWQILYKADDRNLGPRPITISYAEQVNGPWTAVATKLENTGRYDWKLPPGMPGSFFVKVEAADLAGNVGSAQTPQPIVLNAATGAPSEVAIVSVEAAARVWEADPEALRRASASPKAAAEPRAAGDSEMPVAQARFNQQVQDDPKIEVLTDENGKPVDILRRLRAPQRSQHR